MSDRGQPGPLALVGSGEYLPAMEETDRALLERVGGPARARVVVLPTAAGREEPASPARWARLGMDHFERLGARVDAAAILTREHAQDPRWLPLLEAADFIYFSGGDPHHFVATLADTPAWAAISRRHAGGAVLAGCSAGAMGLCGLTASPRAIATSGVPAWEAGLGLLPRVIVLPHFDRFAGLWGPHGLDSVVRALPPDTILLGIDEDTALVRWDAAPEGDQPADWHVMGRQTVSLFEASTAGEAIVHRTGATLTLVTG